MAVTVSTLTKGSDLTAGTTATTASITPTANALVLVAVRAGDQTVSSVSGCGLTWAQVDSFQQFFNLEGVHLWCGTAASPSTGSLTITMSASEEEVFWSVVEATGVVVTGTAGIDGIVQFDHAGDESGTDAAPIVTLAAFASGTNAAYGTFGNGGGVTPSVGSGFTQLHIQDNILITEWKATSDTTVDSSLSAGARWFGIAVELAEDVAGGYFVQEVDGTSRYTLEDSSGFLILEETPEGSPATVTPSVIARSFVTPAASVSAGAVKTAAVISRTFVTPAAQATVPALKVATVISRSFTTPAATSTAASKVIPSVIARTFVTPTATLNVPATRTGTVIARTFVIPAATSKAAALKIATVIARTFTLPTATASGLGVASAAVIARAFTTPVAAAKGAALRIAVVIARLFTLPSATAIGSGVNYYVKNAGSDAADGLSDGNAWQTINKVNGFTFTSGDTVSFNRGDVWRETLNVKNGVTFNAYGSGAKPSIRGSDIAGAWTQEGSLWYLPSITVDPQVFTYDGTLGRRRTSKVSLTQNWDYWWDDPNDRLYVYQSADPATQASLLEYAVRNRILDAYDGGKSADYEDLDVRHNRGDQVHGTFADDTLNFTRCDFVQHGQGVVQYNNGGQGTFTDCTFTDWGIAAGASDYAVQVIGFSGTPSGPVDVFDCTATLTDPNVRSGGDCMAFIGDDDGWLREVSGCTIDLNGVGDEGILTYQPPSTATTVTINDNNVSNAGVMGVAIVGLETNGGTPTVEIARNRILGACASDEADAEGLRVADFTSACDVTVHHNVVTTVDGANTHPGIRVNAATGVKVYHNTVYDADDGIRICNDWAIRASTANVRNNIATACRGTEGVLTGSSSFIAEDYNDWHGTVSGFTAGANSISTDPLLTDPGSNLFTLQAGSPARNIAVAIGGINDTYQESGPDLGAYEAGPVIVATVIARSFAVPQATIHAASTQTATVIARSLVTPVPTVLAGATRTGIVIARSFTLPSPTIQAGAVKAPAVIARTFALPTPALLAASKVSPAVVPLSVVVPFAVGSSEPFVFPNTIPLSSSVPTPSPSVPAVQSALTIARVFALPQAGLAAAVLVTPSGLVLVVVFPPTSFPPVVIPPNARAYQSGPALRKTLAAAWSTSRRPTKRVGGRPRW